MSDYLPADIWSKIFLQLPVESLIRFTTVCKSWRSLILSPDFIYAHLSYSKNLSVHPRYEHNHYLPLEINRNKSDWYFSINLYSDIKPPFEWYYSHGFVGSCDGILCFNGRFSRVVLWNPSVRNHVVLPMSQAILNPNEDQIVVLGFGVANQVYKVVRLVYCLDWYDYPFGVGVPPPQAEVFSIGTEGWRSVGGSDIKTWFYTSDPPYISRQVLLHSIIHWHGFELIDNGEQRNSILTFDINDEVFGEVLLPDELVMESDLCLHKIEGSLAVVKFNDVWVMKEYGVKASWTKLCTIDLDEEYMKVAFFDIFGFKNGEALLLYEMDRPPFEFLYFTYNLETKQAKDLEIFGKPMLFYIDEYVESLLLLKGNSVPAGEEIAEPDTS